MPPKSKASKRIKVSLPSKSRPRGETKNGTHSKLTSVGTRRSKVENLTARCAHPETTLRSRENKQLTMKTDVSHVHLEALDCMYTRYTDADQGSISGICLSKERSLGKEVKKASCKTSDSKKRKHSSKNTTVKPPKDRVLTRIQSEVKSVRNELVDKTSPLKKRRKCTHDILDTAQVSSDTGGTLAMTNSHQEIKARIRVVRQHISDEQTRVDKLKEQLAREKHTARASLGYRRIRIHRELQKVRERVQSEDKKRLKQEDTRIQRQLESSKRRIDSHRVAMKIELAKNWRDRYQQKKQEVRSAKRSLEEQTRRYEMEKRALKKQLQKSWTVLQNRVQEMRDRIETEMFKEGQQWDGVSWTSAIGKFKYSLRRATREKTHIYCRAWKMTHKKEPNSLPSSGATVYKETKQETLTELYQLLDSELRCSICSELFMSAMVLNCSHTFCSYCITQWKRRTNWCPICRTSVTARNPISKLDSFINKFTRIVGGDMEKKRLETIKDREGHEKELQRDGRSWGNLANHSFDDFDDDDDDDDEFLDESLSSDDSDFVNFIEILQDRAASFRRYFGMDVDDDDDDSLESFVDSDETDDGLELFSDDEDDFDEDDEDDEVEGERW